ncbi:bacteriohemerythrin [Pelagicoccus albus]|uniref:Bacteriohemerythrin n=1 Tax=Pelagicoccus albus TaxID=415222 RepID=A0A7X1B810_9BACT|nr:bacteriohemerythrin [Pelagicoccus albus]MBC2607361.1 bacteriohemerythrin [Pelagicoccus albus]
MAIEWDKGFATKDSHIDEQHQQIFRFTNRFESVAQQEDPDLHEVESLLSFLNTYIQNHFRYEEACMLKRKCPAAQKNRSEHIAFKAYLSRSIETYRTEGYRKSWAKDLHKKLEDWLCNHICRVDVQLRDC